jgi:hypothetical protein
LNAALIEFLGLEPAAWLGIVGGALEIFGFALVATELVRAQRRELGHAGPFQFLLDLGSATRIWWRRLRGKTVTHETSAHLSGTTRLTGRGSRRGGTDSEALEDRVRVLEENFEELDGEVTKHRQELDVRIGEEAERVHGALGEFRDEVRAESDQQKAAFADSAKLQWWGIWLFVIGAAASAMANVVGAS